MCGICGAVSCSGCNENPSIPNVSSALAYDGPQIDCPGNFTIRPGDNVNAIIAALAAQICANASGGGGGANNFKVLLPRLETGSSRVQLTGGLGPSNVDVDVWLDRNSCTEDVVLSFINLPAGFSTNIVTIAGSSTHSNVDVTVAPGALSLSWTPQIAATYLMDLELSSSTCGVIVLPVQIILS